MWSIIEIRSIRSGKLFQLLIGSSSAGQQRFPAAAQTGIFRRVDAAVLHRFRTFGVGFLLQKISMGIVTHEVVHQADHPSGSPGAGPQVLALHVVRDEGTSHPADFFVDHDGEVTDGTAEKNKK